MDKKYEQFEIQYFPGNSNSEGMNEKQFELAG